MFHSKRNESHQKSISDDSSRLTSSTMMSVPCCNESRHRVVEIIKPSKSKSFNTDISDEPYDLTLLLDISSQLSKRVRKFLHAGLVLMEMERYFSLAVCGMLGIVESVVNTVQ